MAAGTAAATCLLKYPAACGGDVYLPQKSRCSETCVWSGYSGEWRARLRARAAKGVVLLRDSGRRSSSFLLRQGFGGHVGGLAKRGSHERRVASCGRRFLCVVRLLGGELEGRKRVVSEFRFAGFGGEVGAVGELLEKEEEGDRGFVDGLGGDGVADVVADGELVGPA